EAFLFGSCHDGPVDDQCSCRIVKYRVDPQYSHGAASSRTGVLAAARSSASTTRLPCEAPLKPLVTTNGLFRDRNRRCGSSRSHCGIDRGMFSFRSGMPGPVSAEEQACAYWSPDGRASCTAKRPQAMC